MAWPQPELPVLFPITPWARSKAFFALGHTTLFQDPEPLHMTISSFLLPLIQQTKHLLYAEIMQVITTQFDKNSNQQTLLQYPAGIQNGGTTLSFWGARGRELGEESWRFHIGTDLWAESSMIRNLPVKEGGGNLQMVFGSSVSPHSDIQSWHQSCIQRVSYICILLLLLPRRSCPSPTGPTWAIATVPWPVILPLIFPTTNPLSLQLPEWAPTLQIWWWHSPTQNSTIE